MDRALRYGIDILAGLAGVLIGGILVYWAITSLVAFYFIYEMFTGDSSLPQVRLMQEAGKYTGHSFEGDPWLLLKPTLTGVAMLAAGVGLFVIGARGLFKRLAAGLPEADEGRADSVAGQWASIGVFLFGIFIAGAGLVGSAFNFSSSFQMVFLGVDVEGELMSIKKDPDSPDAGRPRFFVTVRYDGTDGRTQEQTLHVGYSYGGSLRERQERATPEAPFRPIFRYVPGSPETLVLARYVDRPLEYIWFFVWRIAFIYVGICGILRNLPGGGGRAAQPGVPAHTSRSPHAQAPGRPIPRPHPARGGGGGFGRRGA